MLVIVSSVANDKNYRVKILSVMYNDDRTLVSKAR